MGSAPRRGNPRGCPGVGARSEAAEVWPPATVEREERSPPSVPPRGREAGGDGRVATPPARRGNPRGCPGVVSRGCPQPERGRWRGGTGASRRAPTGEVRPSRPCRAADERAGTVQRKDGTHPQSTSEGGRAGGTADSFKEYTMSLIDRVVAGAGRLVGRGSRGHPVGGVLSNAFQRRAGVGGRLGAGGVCRLPGGLRRRSTPA